MNSEWTKCQPNIHMFYANAQAGDRCHCGVVGWGESRAGMANVKTIVNKPTLTQKELLKSKFKVLRGGKLI